MNLTPQVGDTWNLPNQPPLVIVKVKKTHAIVDDSRFNREIPLDQYPALAQSSIHRGATLTRADGTTWSKEIEEFEV